MRDIFTLIVTTSLIGWAHTKTDPCSLSVMMINTAFSHSNEECSPYFLVTTHQTQGRDDIDGLIQERRNSIANALEYVFLAPSLPIRSVICAPPPPPPPLIISYLNAMKSIWHCRNFFLNFILGQCTEHIASHYFVPRHIDSTILRLSNSWSQPLPPLPILTLIIEVKLTLSNHSTLFPRYVTDILLL